MYMEAVHCLLQTEEEIAEVEAEINRLQTCIRYNNKVTKVAQSRLENRINRPSEEMCHDNVQFGLTDESKQLDASLKALEDKLRQSQQVSQIISLPFSIEASLLDCTSCLDQELITLKWSINHSKKDLFPHPPLTAFGHHPPLWMLVLLYVSHPSTFSMVVLFSFPLHTRASFLF